MPIAGTIYLSGCNYQFGWDLISQSTANNTSTVSFYGILNVTNNYVSWSSGSAWIHGASAGMSTYYSKGSYVVVQSNFTFTHNSDGNLTIAPGYGLNTTYTSGSSTVTITLPQIKRYATITGYPSSLTDEGDPYITFTNAGSATNLRVWLEVNPVGTHYATRTLSITSGTYTWELTDSERDELRSVIPNSNSGTIRLGLYSDQGSSTGASYKDIPFSIVNANPTFTDFDFEDVNSTTLALTGDSSTNIDGYSNIEISIPTTKMAVANKGATMTKYRVIVGEQAEDLTYSDSEDLSTTINATTTGTYQVYAIDSRGNTTLVTKLATEELNYSVLTVDNSSKVERSLNGVGTQATLTFSGTIWNDSFGDVSNSIKSAVCQYKATSASTWETSTTDITPTLSGNTFSFSGIVRSIESDYSFDVSTSYNFRITLTDELSSITYTLTPLASGIPNITLSTSGTALGKSYDETQGGKIQFNSDIYVYDEDDDTWKALFVSSS